MRPRLTYANVVATLALVLVLAGGTVYAAVKLGKNSVKSRNIAPGAVKATDLHTNAVSSPKIKDGSIQSTDLAAAVFQGVDTDVTGSAAGGPKGGINTATSTPLPLSGKTSFTPKAGEVDALAAEARFTTASTNAANYCSPAVRILVNGKPTRIYVDPTSAGNQTTLETSLGWDADGPFGLLNVGAPETISAQLEGDADCTADSQLNRVVVRIVQIR